MLRDWHGRKAQRLTLAAEKQRKELDRLTEEAAYHIHRTPNSDAFARTRARTFRGVSGYARNLEQTRPSFQNEAPG